VQRFRPVGAACASRENSLRNTGASLAAPSALADRSRRPPKNFRRLAKQIQNSKYFSNLFCMEYSKSAQPVNSFWRNLSRISRSYVFDHFEARLQFFDITLINQHQLAHIDLAMGTSELERLTSLIFEAILRRLVFS
jgi:hypothetical protein